MRDLEKNPTHNYLITECGDADWRAAENIPSR